MLALEVNLDIGMDYLSKYFHPSAKFIVQFQQIINDFWAPIAV